MEKKDYLDFQSRYERLKNCEEIYRKDLLKYINEAFEKHGDVFEMKPEGCDTWQERQKEEDCNILDELSYYVDLFLCDENNHETHIYRVSNVESLVGKVIRVDGWDWYDERWIRGCGVHYDLNTLSTIVDFINAVLEQEQELNN